jgi:hypothetical protein
MPDYQVPDFDIRKSLSMVFSTHLVVHDWPDSEPHNAELQELVLGKEADDAKNGITRSNSGAWQSAGNLITWKEPCIETFRQRIEKVVSNLLQETRVETVRFGCSSIPGPTSIAGVITISCIRIRTACIPVSIT